MFPFVPCSYHSNVLLSTQIYAIVDIHTFLKEGIVSERRGRFCESNFLGFSSLAVERLAVSQED